MAVALGRRGCVSRRAVPSRTFDDDHTYVRTASYDHGGRPTAMTLPTDPDFDGTAPEIGGSLEYNARGLPSRVNLLVDEGSRAIVDELVYTRDGLVEQVTYGDDLEGDGVSSRTPTVSFTTYDDRRRPIRREDGGSWELAVEQRYLYDASNQRTLKTTTFRGAESGTERTALYVYPGDFERRGLVTSMSGTSYDAVSGDTETQYGVGGARIVWRDGDRDDTLDRDQRVTIALTDLIQSTTAVIDLATGELVESGSYYANGARETYRSNETETVTPEPMGFAGKEADEEVGLTYFGHRYLMAHLGRWASPDPLQTHAVGGGEAVNGYRYVAGNLLQALDPTGLYLRGANVTWRAGASEQHVSAQQNALQALLRLQEATGDEGRFFQLSEAGDEIVLTAEGIDRYARAEAGLQTDISDVARGYMDVILSTENVYSATLHLQASPDEFRRRFETPTANGGAAPHGIVADIAGNQIDTIVGRRIEHPDGTWEATTGYTLHSDASFARQEALGALRLWPDAGQTDRTQADYSLVIVVEGHGGWNSPTAIDAHETAGHAALGVRGDPAMHLMPGTDAHVADVEAEAAVNVATP